MPNEPTESILPKKLTAGQYAKETLGALAPATMGMYGIEALADRTLPGKLPPIVPGAAPKAPTTKALAASTLRSVAPMLFSTYLGLKAEKHLRSAISGATPEEMHEERKKGIAGAASLGLPAGILASVPMFHELINANRNLAPTAMPKAPTTRSYKAKTIAAMGIGTIAALIGDYRARSSHREELINRLRKENNG